MDACGSFRSVLGVVLQVAVVGIVLGALPGIAVTAWEVQRAKWGVTTDVFQALHGADNTKREAVKIPVEESTFSSILGGSPSYWLPFCTFFPGILFAYMSRAHFPIKAAVFSTVSSFAWLLLGYGYGGMIIFRQTFPLVSVAILALATLIAMPQAPKIAHQLVCQVSVLLLGTTLVLALNRFPNENDVFVGIVNCLIYPALREIVRIIATRCAWYLLADAELGGSDFHPRRQHAWVFAGWVQLFWAIYYRFILVTLENPRIAAFVVLWQAALEIGLRLTVKDRDIYIWSLQRKLFPNRRGTKIHPVPDLIGSSALTKSTSEQSEAWTDTHQLFYVLLLFSDMMAEYAGIVVSTLSIYMWRWKPLYMHYQWFSQQPLDQVPDGTPLLYACVIQLVIEVVVDLICFCHERSQVTIKPDVVWFTMDKRSFFALFSIAAWYAYICANGLVAVADDFSRYIGKDACCCVGAGISDGGVMYTYCALLNTTAESPPLQCSGLD